MSENDSLNIKPAVNAEAEFFEILNDFGNPLEILREAISNSVDAMAKTVKISFDVEEFEGNKRLVITISDDGTGMSQDVLTRDFWGLGFSPSRDKKDTIGEKGHGTKIYLRSEKIIVKTQSKDGAFISECDRPLISLAKKELHNPTWCKIDNFMDHTGTEIKVIGYNDNERSKFVQDFVKDYLFWFTKLGSIEKIFDLNSFNDFKILLKCLDKTEFEEIKFGHPFPEENSDINKLFDEKGASAADSYVKRYVWKDQRLKNHPEVLYDVIISVEGDEVKRDYNPMIRERSRADTGRYRVSDRYGIWLCKDYIPVIRVNEWISGFGSGSNAFVLLHGFINCQSLKLTANRGTIANTDPKILEELQNAVQSYIGHIDNELNNYGLYTLRGWQQESLTLQQEKTDFNRRIKKIKNKKIARIGNIILVEPNNESELFGLLISVYSIHPEIFDFQPVDYDTTRGIDIIAKNKTNNFILDGEHSYIELKYFLQNKKFNHSFNHLRWIVCWDFDKSISTGIELTGIEDNDIRKLKSDFDDNKKTLYFLDSPKKHKKIQVIRLKEYLKQHLKIEFEPQVEE